MWMKMLLPWIWSATPDLMRDVKFPTVDLSGSPEIKGYVMLMDYSDPVCSPKVVVDDTAPRRVHPGGDERRLL